MILAEKNWDRHVECAELLARSSAFSELQEAILARAEIAPHERVVDLGAGTGLLTIPAAERADRVWAIDISDAMSDYVATKAHSADVENVVPVVASVVSLPLVDDSVDVAISNYCFHHLRDADKLTALREVHRVLRPGGRLVFADMMFTIGLGNGRDRAVLGRKIKALLARGPAGAWRLARNAVRWLLRRWEKPARPEWWRDALEQSGFVDVSVEPLEHEGGLAWARKR